MEPTSLEHSRSREQKWFRWTMGWSIGAVIGILMAVGGWYWLVTEIRGHMAAIHAGGAPADMPEIVSDGAMILMGTGWVALLICALGFLISFIAWLVALRRRRKLMGTMMSKPGLDSSPARS